MADEAEEGAPQAEAEPPGEQLSEIHVTIGEHSKYIADNFDKLYDEVELLKVRTYKNKCQFCNLWSWNHLDGIIETFFYRWLVAG